MSSPSLAAASGALAQDAAAGKTSFNKCLACHAIGEGAKNKVGPELNGLDGRKSGTVEGYSYSDANKNSGITWNKDQFLEYIKDPKAKIPGTKMVFAGIKNEKEANDLWAYVSPIRQGRQDQVISSPSPGGSETSEARSWVGSHERSECETGWGDLSTRALLDGERLSPHPAATRRPSPSRGG